MSKTKKETVKDRSSRRKRSPKTGSQDRPNRNQVKIEQTLKKNWELGKSIDEFCKSGVGNTISAFADQNDMPERTVRTLRKFFESYPKLELDKFLEVRRKASGFPLTSGHVAFLLTIKSDVPGYGRTPEQARQKFAKEAAEKNYSPAQLNAAIKRACGRSSNNKGKPLDVSNLDAAMHQVTMEALAWTKRCRAIWDRMLSQHSISKLDRNQIRSLLLACGEFCEAAKSVIDAREEEEREKFKKQVEKAQEKVAAILEKTMAKG
jgi:hypothetical protein